MFNRNQINYVFLSPVLIVYFHSLIDREERTMAKHRSLYNSNQFDFEIYHPLEEVFTS